MMLSRSQLDTSEAKGSMIRLERGAGQAFVDPILDLVLHEGQQQILKGLKWESGGGGMNKSVFLKTSQAV